jgi:sugar lactone lactonase YvrE
VEDREVPFVQPIVRTAAVDAQGQLWISLVVPFTYVYDADGDKTRTVQFSATGILSPTSLFFTGGGRILVTPGCYEYDPRRIG